MPEKPVQTLDECELRQVVGGLKLPAKVSKPLVVFGAASALVVPSAAFAGPLVGGM